MKDAKQLRSALMMATAVLTVAPVGAYAANLSGEDHSGMFCQPEDPGIDEVAYTSYGATNESGQDLKVVCPLVHSYGGWASQLDVDIEVVDDADGSDDVGCFAAYRTDGGAYGTTLHESTTGVDTRVPTTIFLDFTGTTTLTDANIWINCGLEWGGSIAEVVSVLSYRFIDNQP